ncbi:UNVERIFIED_CONTAM: hypothetical protein HDU68_001577 [Siphonaria sp. JEL0065]|nr:hypothetical protein HDU68_001577 [Siphonaria sp. JEL0065]
MSTDLIGYIIAITAAEIGSWPATKKYTFGFTRVELLGALVSLLLTWNLIYHLIEEASDRILNPSVDEIINAPAMALGALFSVLANGFMAFVLHDDDGHHDDKPVLKHDGIIRKQDDDDIHPKPHIHRHHQNLNIQAASIHALSDLLGSLSILVASLILMYEPKWTILDPLCTILVAVIIFGATLDVARQSFNVLMETCPEGVDVDAVKESVVALGERVGGGVVGVEECRVWSLVEGRECCVLVIAVGRPTSIQASVGMLTEKGKLEDVFANEGMESDDATTLNDLDGLVPQLGETEGKPAPANHNDIAKQIKETLSDRFGFSEIYVEIKTV